MQVLGDFRRTQAAVERGADCLMKCILFSLSTTIPLYLIPRATATISVPTSVSPPSLQTSSLEPVGVLKRRVDLATCVRRSRNARLRQEQCRSARRSQASSLNDLGCINFSNSPCTDSEACSLVQVRTVFGRQETLYKRSTGRSDVLQDPM